MIQLRLAGRRIWRSSHTNIFDSLTKIYMENKLVVYDHLLLNPFKESLDQMGILNQYSHYGTFIVINENVTNDLIAALKTSFSNTNNMKIGIASTTCKGFVITHT